MKWLAGIAIVLFFSEAMAAEATFRSRPANGGFPGQWLTVFPGSARTAGLGGASVALDGAGAVVVNPAAAAGDGSGEVSLMVAPLFSAGQFQNLNVVHPLSDQWGLGLTVAHMGSGRAEETDVLGRSVGSFSEDDLAALFSAGRHFAKWDAGMNLKMARQSLANASATGFGADAGVRVRPWKPNLVLGLSVQNLLAPSMKLGSETEKFERVAQSGVAYQFRLLKRRFLLAADISRVMGGSSARRWAAGIEAEPVPLEQFPFLVRMGANDREYTVGFGVSKGPVNFDYAAVLHELEVVHRFGIAVRYGVLSPFAENQLKSDRENVKKQEEALKQEWTNIKLEKQRLSTELKFKALVFEAKSLWSEGKYAECNERVVKALSLRPDDPEVLAIKEDLRGKKNEQAAQAAVKKGKELYDAGKYADAVPYFNQAIFLQSKDPDVKLLSRLAQARVYLDLKNYKGAEQMLSEVLKMAPGNKDAATLYDRIKDVLEAYDVQ